MIRLNIETETHAEFFRDLAGIGGKQILAGIATENLIDELRGRMAAKGHVVNIDPISACEPTAPVTPAPEVPADKPRRGRPPKAAAAEQEPDPAPAPTKKPNGEAPLANTNVSRDDVIAALNAYSASRGGQTAGRQKMQEVCGVARLQDIKPEDYPRLIEALRA